MKAILSAAAILLVAIFALAYNPNENHAIIIYHDDGSYEMYHAYTHRNYNGRLANTIIYPPSYFQCDNCGDTSTYTYPGTTRRNWTAPPTYEYNYQNSR